MNKTAGNDVAASIDTHADQPCRQKNIEVLTGYYRSTISQQCDKTGIELEHFIVHVDDGTPVSYSEEHGIHWLLHQLSHDYPDTTFDVENDLIGVGRNHKGVRENVTLEPAAQLELSAGPFESLENALECYTDFDERITKLIEPWGQRIVLVGYQPYAKALDTELIPKRRYRYMDRYLSAIGPWGPRMMRGTASTQISIDYDSEQDGLRKLRLASLCTPLFSLMCDNSPVFEGKPRPHQMMRTEVWLGCDPDRCGVIPGAADPGFTLEDCAARVLDTPAIVIPDGNNEWAYDTRTFGEIYAEHPMTQADAIHAVSMTFHDVRLKTYVEIRPADALPIEYVIAYAALVKGLFADDERMSQMESLFGDAGDDQILEAKESLMRNGYSGEAYGAPAWKLAERLCMIAKLGLPKSERELLEPLMMLVMNRTTPADLTVID